LLSRKTVQTHPMCEGRMGMTAGLYTQASLLLRL
jgi:hypothetical protein